ncbi:hypothetical protein VNO80_06503 [Phaseolus coccineus]|uniref:Uncharacterized protein n=1 Tax=Phaseolus coccineus TaxID=3886 RepID=A0AAN9NI49_PHACN
MPTKTPSSTPPLPLHRPPAPLLIVVVVFDGLHNTFKVCYRVCGEALVNLELEIGIRCVSQKRRRESLGDGENEALMGDVEFDHIVLNKDDEVSLFESNDVLVIKHRFLECLLGRGDEVDKLIDVNFIIVKVVIIYRMNVVSCGTMSSGS